ncbi:hypothetical protein ACFWR9_11780 [Streptomyces sp. NPDC058534]|uniref:hypothetical protein n=1 Tax=Streptomyces sp. NPDC058534 TaxID=3346541 RepID=UPI00365140ED
MSPQSGIAHPDALAVTLGLSPSAPPDVIELLVAASRRAARSELAVVGTDTLLGGRV